MTAATCEIRAGDCVAVMATLDAESIDAVVTDPPYGLEFMGKDWDKLVANLPQEGRWEGRRTGGGSVGDDARTPASRSRVAYGAKQHTFKRCGICGRREFSGSPCRCEAPAWEYETAQAASSAALGMQAWHEAWAREAYRVMKPGAHLLAFSGTRTYHRMACGIEDAGFEIRDQIGWCYGSGFPKSLDIGKALDGKDGRLGWESPNAGQYGGIGGGTAARPGNARMPDIVVELETDLARQWDGWGTALKPAWEPIVVARKPLRGTVAANVAKYGTGGINVDGCRIGTDWSDRPESWKRSGHSAEPGSLSMFGTGGTGIDTTKGRWPANLVLGCACDGDHDPACASRKAATKTITQRGGGDSGELWRKDVRPRTSEDYADQPCSCGWRHDPACAVAVLDAQSGERPSTLARLGEGGDNPSDVVAPGMFGVGGGGYVYGDTGGASRFFYTAKSSRAERERGLDALEPKRRSDGRAKDIENPRLRTNDRRNFHPTVKPVDLMQWLCRLVTPPGGLVLDPFAGSGTTGIAALREGFRFLGIDQDVEYCEIARARIVGDCPMFNAPAMAGGA